LTQPLPHGCPGVPPLIAPHPPQALSPGSLQPTAFVPLQTYVPQLPQAPPSVPPVMAPQPLHAFFPGSLQVTALPPLQA
jgi:hypothetical protein